MQYKALQADAFGSPPSGSYTDSISPAQPSTSSSATLTFTPLIAGYWQVSASCGVTVTDTQTNQYWTGSANAEPEDLTSYTFDITYTGPVVGGGSDSGTVVTNKTTDVHAGWPIRLGAKLSPVDLSKTFTWTISGAGGNGSAAINGYTVSSDKSSATVDALAPGGDTKSTFPDPASSPTMLQSYYYTESGSYTASVQPQGVSGSNTAKTTFDVSAPTTTLAATYQFATRIIAVGAGPKGAATIYLEATNAIGQPGGITSQQAGILFTHPQVHSTTFQGHSYFVQVYTEDDLWTGIAGVANYSANGSGLDGDDPYDVNGDLNGNDFVLDGPSESTDANANQINYSSLKIEDSPQMWVMYTPAATGSIDVPLASSPWLWGGTVTATYNAATKTWSTPWTLTNPLPSVPGSAPAPATNSYPVWNQILPVPVPPK